MFFEVGRDTIRTIANTALWCALRFKKDVGAPKVVCYEPELDHQIPPIHAALYNAWIRYQQTIQKALAATHNNLELLAAIASKFVCF